MLGNKIKELREEKGLKQEDLAKAMSVSPSTIGMYEINKREPNNELIIKLAAFFDVSVDYLLGKSDIRKPLDIELSDIDIAFATGIKGLNEENKEIAKNIIEGLLAKQENEEKKK